MSERYTCRECSKTYASLATLKTHMEKFHGGYSEEDIAAALPTPEGGQTSEPDIAPSEGVPREEPPPYTPPPFAEPAPAPEPKRLSKSSRETNERFNVALRLILKHLTKGLTPEEKTQLEYNRDLVFDACMGVEFDFEEKLVTFRSRIWLYIGLLVIWIGDQLPGAGMLLAALKEKGKGDATSK